MKIHVPNHLIIISMGVFLALNMFENIIHFSIGRNIKEKDNDGKTPIETSVNERIREMIYVYTN